MNEANTPNADTSEVAVSASNGSEVQAVKVRKPRKSAASVAENTSVKKPAAAKKSTAKVLKSALPVETVISETESDTSEATAEVPAKKTTAKKRITKAQTQAAIQNALAPALEALETVSKPAESATLAVVALATEPVVVTQENPFENSRQEVLQTAQEGVQPEVRPVLHEPRDAKPREDRNTRARQGRNRARAPTENSAKPNGAHTKNAFSFNDVISGDFDVKSADDDSADSQAQAKRVLRPEPESPKLHKVLAQAGLGSRLEMEQMILEGKISVNNEPAHIGQRIQFGDQLRVNGKPLRMRIAPPAPRVLAYHKPVGEVVTMDDPQNRPTVFRKLPRLQNGKWQSVGRLDLNTEGLLLFTNSGELANKLMHPRFGLEREYAVRVLGALSNDEKQRLLDGVKLDDGIAQFGSIEAGGGEGANCWYKVTISEGRNREVRRMFEAIGHAVSRLIRIRYGSMMLPVGLRRGFWLELDERDIAALSSASGFEAAISPQRGAGRSQNRTNTENPNAENARGGKSNKGGRPHRSRQNEPMTKPVFGSPREQEPRHQRGESAESGHGNPSGFKKQGNKEGYRSEGRTGQKPMRSKGGAAQGSRHAQLSGDTVPNFVDPLQTGVLSKVRPPRFGNPQRSGGGGEPDPMRTSFGYIGADSLNRSRNNNGGQRSRPVTGGGRPSFGGGTGGGSSRGGSRGGKGR